MNPLVSVIIPTRNSERTLDALLESIKDQSYKDIELIIVDSGSSDETNNIAKKFTDKVFDYDAERNIARNFGATQARGDYFLMLDSDMVLTPTVVAEGIEKFVEDKEIGSLVIPEESFGEGFWAKCKKLERSFYIGVDWMSAARFFRRDVFERVGGYSKTTNAEDWDLSQRVGTITHSATIKSYIFHDEGRVYLFKNAKKRFFYVQDFGIYKNKESNRLSAKKQMSIIRRYGLFLSQPKKLLEDPLVGIGMLIMKALEFIFAGCGYLVGQRKLNSKSRIKKLEFTGERMINNSNSDIFLYHRKRYDFSLDFCRDKDVLDIACGSGYGSDLIAGVAHTVVGADSDSNAVEYCLATYKRKNLEFKNLDGRQLVANFVGRFDVITSFETVEHIREYQLFLSNLYKYLKPGGILILSTPNNFQLTSPPTNKFHIREFDLMEMSAILKATEFQQVRLYGQCFTLVKRSTTAITPDRRLVVSVIKGLYKLLNRLKMIDKLNHLQIYKTIGNRQRDYKRDFTVKAIAEETNFYNPETTIFICQKHA